MKQFLYRIQPSRVAILTEGATAEESAAVEAHFNYLERLLGENVVLLAGRTLTRDEQTFGIVIFVAPTEEAALAIMHGDPAVQGGVMKAELFPYRIALWAPKGPPPEVGAG